MMKKNAVKWLFAPMLLIAVSSCSDDDLFDKEAYVDKVKTAFPVADIDPQHTWSSMGSTQLSAHLCMEKAGTYMVRVYADMPKSGETTELLAAAEMNNGELFTTKLNYRLHSPIIYLTVEDERGFVAVYPRVVNSELTETEVGNAVANTQNKEQKVQRIAARYDFPDFPSESDFATVVPADAHPMDQYAQDNNTGNLVQNYYVDASTTQLNPWAGNVKIYFKPGTYTINYYPNIPYNAQLYFLPGANVTFTNYLSCTMGLTAFYIAKGATVNFNNTLAVAIGIYNRGTMNINTFEVSGSGVLINEGTINVKGGFALRNYNACFVNGDTFAANTIELADGSKMQNLGTVNVSGLTTLTGNMTTWVNDGYYETGTLNSQAGSDQIINNCRLKVNGLFKLWNSNSTNMGFTEDAGASAEMEEFYINTANVFLGSNALFKVNGTATLDCANPTYGIYGKGTDAGQPAVFQAKDIVKGTSSSTNQVTYGGYLWVASDTHFEQKIDDWNMAYNIADDKVSFALGMYDAQTSIPASECTPGYGQALTPTNPPVDGEMRMTYCYEDNFPVPGDYDFNDVVLGLKMEKKPRRNGASRDTLVLKVEVKAVGATEPIGAALRLKNIKEEHLSSTFSKTSDASRKMFHFFNIERYNKILSQSEKGDRRFLTALSTQEMVIPLFNDAHYAINGGVKENGDTKRRFYNTIVNPNEKGENFAAADLPENTYAIYFKDPNAFNNFKIEDVDLFIIEEFNGTCYEVHTYPYKQDEVTRKWHNGSTAYSDNYPWGLAVPSDFRYPIEWTPIGTCPINNVVGGAYQLKGHSFSEWAKDHTKATDWYEYPMPDLVY